VARALASAKVGKSKAAKTAIMVMTTNSSIKVKPEPRFRVSGFGCLGMHQGRIRKTNFEI
jgi:hypothetical protein